ncbi:Arginine-hydroxylase NDUFAF5, mitochondrial [Seminavis robusta]|uniref:Arginine-hydroxylase NDUFAF5, mitochondrial n=1 Tax=Seminavis robusta TaxID=568900 RepID=A0A9N8DH80_9STRA|nr:Arginine-hydroxylase NDUFAF5, mitochondrial [Seminavis robusta]|eukprot:Sro84_g045030.1 Arginine-hydroxylase NDUFAF5, mitochondrial (396) ;mRNA; f:106526-107814
MMNYPRLLLSTTRKRLVAPIQEGLSSSTRSRVRSSRQVLRPPCCLSRSLSSSSDGSSTSVAFDRTIKQRQRDNAARAQQLWKQADDDINDTDRVSYDYFREEIARRLVDRLDDIRREEGFPLTLDVGSGPGYIYRAICADDALEGEGGIGGVRKLVQLDSSQEMLHRDAEEEFEGMDRCGTYRMHAEEEGKLPFPDGTFDLVISSCALHWVNNLPGLFKEAHRVLKPDGCFMFAMVGGETLPELRVAMVMAELEREGGVSPHVGPFVELSDIGSLMQRAKFALPTIDIDTVHVSYPDAFVLMEHLQRMGENNASIKKRERTAQDTFLATACIYDELYAMQPQDGDPDLGNKEVEASVQVIFAIGWTPDASQQQPKARGSATHKIGEVVVDKTDGQ